MLDLNERGCGKMGRMLKASDEEMMEGGRARWRSRWRESVSI